MTTADLRSTYEAALSDHLRCKCRNRLTAVGCSHAQNKTLARSAWLAAIALETK